jgi:hypothetical protein
MLLLVHGRNIGGAPFWQRDMLWGSDRAQIAKQVQRKNGYCARYVKGQLQGHFYGGKLEEAQNKRDILWSENEKRTERFGSSPKRSSAPAELIPGLTPTCTA